MACGGDKKLHKGFAVEQDTQSGINSGENQNTPQDTFPFIKFPRNVLKTFYRQHRVIPHFKLNYNTKKKRYYSGSNSWHSNYSNEGNSEKNNWNRNFMPGFEAIYGYNMVNVAHFNVDSNNTNLLFNDNVLIKTFYYPAHSNDTLKGKPIIRSNYFVTVYDEDTNEDGFINTKDLRRFYFFDLNGNNQTALIDKSFGVTHSEYDYENDYMYVYARKDENQNGEIEKRESLHIFWIDLSNPLQTGQVL